MSTQEKEREDVKETDTLKLGQGSKREVIEDKVEMEHGLNVSIARIVKLLIDTRGTGYRN